MPHPWLPIAVPGSAAYAALQAAASRWGWGGSMRPPCRAKTRKGVRCGAPVLKGSDLCRRHAGPTASRLRRARELRAFEAGRISPEQWARSEVRRTRNRICNQRRYKSGWLKRGITLRFSPELEDAFQEAARAVLGTYTWDELPDPARDRLRWAWRRYQLDRPRPEAWQAKARAILLDLAARGPGPDTLEHDPGTGPHVVVVDRRPTGFSARTKMAPAEVDKAKALPAKVKAQLARRGTGRGRRAVQPSPTPFDVDAFMQAHGRDLRNVLRLAVSADAVRAVALAYRAVLAAEPDAHAAWMRLVARLGRGDSVSGPPAS